MNYTYIIKCADSTLYTGWTNDLFEVDEKTNLKTWTVMETIVGLVGIVGATIVWFVVS